MTDVDSCDLMRPVCHRLCVYLIIWLVYICFSVDMTWHPITILLLWLMINDCYCYITSMDRLWNEQLRSNGACVPSTLCTAGLYICFLCWQRLETQSPFCNMTAASPWLIHSWMNSCDLMVHVHKSRNPCACCVQCSLDWQVLRYNHHSAALIND